MLINTLTMNPALDKSTSAKMILPANKIRCEPPCYDAGGGGINVSRAMHKLGGKSIASYLAGGENGEKISVLLEEEGIQQNLISSGAETRENLMVLDNTTSHFYRFGMPGPKIGKTNWMNVLSYLENLYPKPDYLVASGSLPPGVPDDFYARVASFARKNEIKLIIDTSGPPLKQAIKEGVYMIKPNIREMASLLNTDTLTGMELEKAAGEILEKNKCEMIVLSLGSKGAMMLRKGEEADYVTPPIVPVKSTVGAGDSMVAGIMMGFSKGYWHGEAVRYGVAAGTAASMTPGSELCRKEDADRIYNWLSERKGEGT